MIDYSPLSLEDQIKNEVLMEIICLASHFNADLNDKAYQESYDYICKMLEFLCLKDGVKSPWKMN